MTRLTRLGAADRRPIGFFDSGVGGTSVLAAVRRLCPEEALVYLADAEHCPYGNRSPEEIVRLSKANVEELLRADSKLIVVACNTATAAAIDTLRSEYPEIPFVGLEPAIKPAALKSATGVVGVLATAGTFNGRLYNETKARFAKKTTVIAAVADEFVVAVERLYRGQGLLEILGHLENPDHREKLLRLRPLVAAKVEPLLKAGADKIVLGCTHFPHLRPVIEEVCAGRAEVIDPSPAVARQVRRVLAALEAAS